MEQESSTQKMFGAPPVHGKMPVVDHIIVFAVIVHVDELNKLVEVRGSGRAAMLLAQLCGFLDVGLDPPVIFGGAARSADRGAEARAQPRLT